MNSPLLRSIRLLASSRLLVLVVASASLGCTGGEELEHSALADVPYVRGSEVERLVQNASKPTLLEFCVPQGCFRCDEMRSSIDALAREGAECLTVRRINLNTDRQLAVEWGVQVCPTYVVFAEGREVGRIEYPTTADLVAAMIPYPLATD